MTLKLITFNKYLSSLQSPALTDGNLAQEKCCNIRKHTFILLLFMTNQSVHIYESYWR